MQTRAILAAAFLVFSASAPGYAQPAPVQRLPAPPRPPGEAALMTSMATMTKDMSTAPITGNPDHDFVAMMIPHHQGAIDMAKFELAHGTDPAMRKLATAIVAAQEKEIAEMQTWQQAH